MNDHRVPTSHGAAADVKSVSPNALTRKLAAVAGGTEIPFRVVLTDGAVIDNGGASPPFVVTFRTRHAERRTVALGYVGLLESYFAGGIDIDGEIALAFRAGFDSGVTQSLA
ncbi:MAG TPA: hypothetical protein VL742_16955 [Casimicrobiaceae bacterium]|nr:hypothetical protein [Casimicrobiaceae bacterium]